MENHVEIKRTPEELKALLAEPKPPKDLIPGLMEAVSDPAKVRARPAMSYIPEEAQPYLDDIENIPWLTYTRFRDVQRKADRAIWERPYWEKRAKMGVAGLQVLLGDDAYLNTLYDYIWSTCEETVWIVAQRRDLEIDLRSAATGLSLAEMAVGLKDKLEDRLVERIRREIDRRIFTRYLDRKEVWWKGHNNWNGVCNGGVGAMFLLLEEDTDRLARGLADVLEGLEVFLNTAFEADGASGEGAGYWHYGMSNFVVFSEMLRRRTEGAVDLLALDRVREIAEFPLKIMLSPGRYFSYSDSNEVTSMHPGLIQRLAERTGLDALYDLLAEPAPLRSRLTRFHQAWRALMWWDGRRSEEAELGDALLPESKIARLTGKTPEGSSVILATKAQHNGVSHNHDDVGVFVLHVDGETLICDPERGLYDQYVFWGKDKVIFSNSYGHSVPVISNRLQSSGKEFAGEIVAYDPDGEEKEIAMRIEGAYESIWGLDKALRTLQLTPEGELVLEDEFRLSRVALPVEEAVVTWLDTTVDGSRAVIAGEKNDLELTIEAPEGVAFELEVLEEASKANNKERILKRLSFTGKPADKDLTMRLRAKVTPKS
jgi:hypothetical protein